MGFLSETQVIESANRLMKKDAGGFIRTNGLWHVLIFLRFCACKDGLKEYEFLAYDLAQAAFDLNGIVLPISNGGRDVYFEPGATQGNFATKFFRHHEGPRQTYLNRIYTGLTGSGPKQPKLFDASGISLPVKISLTENWLQNLRASGDNRFILDEHAHDLITWIFRFGIPKNGHNTAHFSVHGGNGNLSMDTSVVATSLPTTLVELEDTLKEYFSLTQNQLKELMPELRNVRLGEWTEQIPINISTFGPRLVTELSAATNSQNTSVTNSHVTNDDFADIVGNFTVSSRSAGLTVSDATALRFAASLLAKRFLILTGLSGSGKTKLAQAFAAWISETEEQYRFVAVGADWTTNENVVGYQDALQPNFYRKPSNGALDVILRAHEENERAKHGGDPARPYFLILDEMNLSHVERYFADILSAIESGQEIALHSAGEKLKASEDDPLLVPHKIPLPDNLFIIGTVNVDETTYMFSPKVLDRANVIEFRATADDILAFLDSPARVDMGALSHKGAAFGQAFVAEAGADVVLDDEIAIDLKNRLTEIFGELAKIGAEFGFRTTYEIVRFVSYHKKLSGSGWQFKDALDAQILQKLMPKLHGSERKLGPVLEALESFCDKYQCGNSRQKIQRMRDRLKADGFTSFAEA
jgi:energy-coupling factor transporter ATP-binding protein EcfA2